MADTPKPWTSKENRTGQRLFAPATQRNREAIRDVLREMLPASGEILEIASGSGEHCMYFARQFPSLTWQPSDADPAALASITVWREEAQLPNLKKPIFLNAAGDEWGIDHADAILCINMIHISPWEATLGLLRGAGRTLPQGGMLYLYGPYVRDNVATAPSNLAFDANLKARNPLWGIRDLADVRRAAEQHGFDLTKVVEMPANNLSVVFRKSHADGDN